MNTPNMLTVARIILAPVFLLFLVWDSLPHNFLIACIIFAIASLTDMLDGNIARKYNLITDFGKFLDPLADKMLVTAALIGLLSLDICNVWVVMIIITREFLVTSLRLVAAGGGKVISASVWGKIKTISQIVAIIYVLVAREVMEAGWFVPESYHNLLVISGDAVLWIAAGITIISGVHYIWKHADYVNINK